MVRDTRIKKKEKRKKIKFNEYKRAIKRNMFCIKLHIKDSNLS
jgi:hypothetical protein